MTLPLRIFRIFLRLGCTSFGGPTVHLGYFRDEFVEKRKWFSDKQYADLQAVRRPGGAVPIPARAGVEPGGYGDRPAARRVPGHVPGVGGLHAAVGAAHGGVRAGRRAVGRYQRGRLAARSEGCGCRCRGAGCVRHDEEPGHRQDSRRDRRGCAGARSARAAPAHPGRGDRARHCCWSGVPARQEGGGRPAPG